MDGKIRSACLGGKMTAFSLKGKIRTGEGGGTDDYDSLRNRPEINGVLLSGNRSFEELGLYIDRVIDEHSSYEHCAGSMAVAEYVAKAVAGIDLSEYLKTAEVRPVGFEDIERIISEVWNNGGIS